MIAKDHIWHVTATTEEFGYLIRHEGILFEQDGQQFILHRTFGGAEIIPLSSFTAKRKIILKKEYKLKHDVDLDEILLNEQQDEFELINNNCENFCNDFINAYTYAHRCRFSKQVLFWIILATIILIATYKNR